MMINGGSFSRIHLYCLSAFILFSPYCASGSEISSAATGEKNTETSVEPATEEAVEFDPQLLRQERNSQAIDVSRFAYGASVMPGKYRIDILVNQQPVAHDEVVFTEGHNKIVTPCLTPKIVKLIKLNVEKLPFDSREDITAPGACTDLAHLLPGASVKFNADKQQLDINVPQIYMQHISRGSVDPAMWDSGVPALMLGYYMNGYESHYDNAETSRSFYSSLNAGLNIGKWYLRHNGSYNWDQDAGGHYQSSNTYLQRDTEFVNGRLYLGQYYTSGQMFNSLSFTGAQLATDDRMLPASQRGYAPEIRGWRKPMLKSRCVSREISSIRPPLRRGPSSSTT